MKKRFVLIVLIIAIVFTNMTIAAIAENRKEDGQNVDEKQLYAKSACLMDADSGRILFGKNENEILPMASTTKIMTCILALEYASLDRVVGISEYASTMPDVQLNAKKGEYYLLKDLLFSLMLESHNDSAVAIAEYFGGSVFGDSNSSDNSVEQSKKYVAAFADQMNQKAKDIGCSNTFFLTPNGLDASISIRSEDNLEKNVFHSTTAAELAKIMSYCITQSSHKKEFLEITQAASHTFHNVLLPPGPASGEAISFKSGNIVHSCSNHNAFLKMMPGVISGKTGFTAKAGYCYVGALTRDGKVLVVALLACGWPNNRTYKWHDSKILMNYGLSAFEKKNYFDLFLPDFQKITVRNAGKDKIGASISIRPVVDISNVSNQRSYLLGKTEQVDVIWHLPKELDAPVKKGTVIGRLEYRINDEVLEVRNILCEETIEKNDYIHSFLLIIRKWCSGICISNPASKYAVKKV